MKKLLFAVLAYILLSASSCATFDGFTTDIGRLSSRAPSIVNTQQASAEACEPVYRREGASMLYSRCLEIKMMEEAPPDKVQFGKAFPECKKIYESKTGQWNKYRSCQEDAYLKYVVQPKVRQMVQRRVGLAKRSQ